MKQCKKYLIILLFIVIYTFMNNSSKSISINNKRYFGQKYLRASDYLIVTSNEENVDLKYSDLSTTFTIRHNKNEINETSVDYRYIGREAVNYVSFNCFSDDKSSCELWRIIGIFYSEDENNNFKYRLKLMRNESIGKISFDENNNNFESSSLYNYLNNEYYNSLSQSAKNMIVTTKFYTAGGNLSSYNAEIFYDNERLSTDFFGKVGLIYPSDYLYTYYKLDEDCIKNLGYCLKKKSSWMSNISDNQFWTITSVSGTSQIYSVSNNSNIDRFNSNELLDVYPVVYIDYDTIISDGEGTYENPYQIRQLNNSEIQNEYDMDTTGLDKSNVVVDDTLSNKSIIIIIISVILVISGSIIIAKLYLGKKRNI